MAGAMFPADAEVLVPPSASDLAALRAELTSLGATRSHDLVVSISVDKLATADWDQVAQAMAGEGVTWLLANFGRRPAAEVEAQVAAGPPGASGRLGG